MSKPQPCPICGGEPEIFDGFQDAPLPHPLLSCPTVFVWNDLSVACPMHADGIEAWNYICKAAEIRHGRSGRGE